MSNWTPASATDVSRVLAEQLAACTERQRELFERLRIPLRRYPIPRAGGLEQVFAVGQSGGRVLFWEDVEEGFELATPDSDGVIRDYGADQFELKHVLAQLLATEAS